MRDFRPSNREGGFGGRGGGRSGGFGGGRGGGNRGGGFGGRGNFSGGGRDSPRPEMHEATCSKCGKQCRVPFRPTGSKPVFCSDCFRQEGEGSRNPDRNNFISRQPMQAGISPDQFKQLNLKLDKIIKILQDLEIDVDAEGDEDDSELDEVIDEDLEDEESEKETKTL